jgi:hypothetical protein
MRFNARIIGLRGYSIHFDICFNFVFGIKLKSKLLCILSLGHYRPYLDDCSLSKLDVSKESSEVTGLKFLYELLGVLFRIVKSYRYTLS